MSETVIIADAYTSVVIEIEGTGPQGPKGNLEVENDSGYVYIYGDVSTDGSIRLHRHGTMTHLEMRTSGVWQDSSLMTGSGTVWVII
jgi:hypothetical protein